MRRLSLLLVLTVLVSATPALAAGYHFHPVYTGTYPYTEAKLTEYNTAEGSWHDNVWWCDGNFLAAPPGAGDVAKINLGHLGGHGPTAVITMDVTVGEMCVGALGYGGHVRQDSGAVSAHTIWIANNVSQGSYTINGGLLSVATLRVGNVGGGATLAQFVIGGSAPTSIAVGTGDFTLYSDGDLVLNLDDSANGVRKMTVANAATLSGEIVLNNLDAFAGAGIDILTCVATLNYGSATLDAASVAAGWSLTDDGAGTLQAIPEPAAMVLLFLGSLAKLTRRGALGRRLILLGALTKNYTLAYGRSLLLGAKGKG